MRISKLDNINRQILIILEKDGRYSYTKLAKKLNLKVSTISKRINYLLDNDLISINAVPNPHRIGYKVMAFIALNVEILKVKNVCAKLIENPNISSIVTTFGRFDILIFAEFLDLIDLNKLVREELPDIEGINRIDTFFISEIKKRYEKIFSSDSLIDDPVQICEMDEKLINELRKDGRANYTELAKKYNTSSATISRRVASLIRNDVIKITVVPNPSKLLGFSVVAYLGLQTELKKIDRISDEISSFPEVYTAMTLMSSFSILAIVVLPNFELLYKFIIDKIAPINSVIKVETLIRAELVKRTYLAFNLEKTLDQLETDDSI